MEEKKHKWWHFIFGKTQFSETVYKEKNFSTMNYWNICNKCGEQVGEKQGVSTFSFNLKVK